MPSDSTTYLPKDMLNAMTIAFGSAPAMSCVNDLHGTPVVADVYLCFTPLLQVLRMLSVKLIHLVGQL